MLSSTTRSAFEALAATSPLGPPGRLRCASTERGCLGHLHSENEYKEN